MSIDKSIRYIDINTLNYNLNFKFLYFILIYPNVYFDRLACTIIQTFLLIIMIIGLLS